MTRIITFFGFISLAISCASTTCAVTFDWATVGNPGNADDIHGDGYGGVDYTYRISRHEVTNAQYTEFLNAVDPTGTNTLSLYTANMAIYIGGIENTGTVDGARYIAKAGREQNPVNFVSFFDAMRFVNWLHNGQGSGDTETGVYTIGTGTDEVRSANATFWIPNADEWYKAAYYEPNSGVYYDYPTGTDSEPYSDNPASLNTPDDTNVANFRRDDSIENGYNDGHAVSGSNAYPSTTNPLTDVGAYSLAASPYGTFDQGGNVWEWNEEVMSGNPVSIRGLRGGSWGDYSFTMLAFAEPHGDNPYNGDGASGVGFRVASRIPEPSTGLLGSLAATGVFLWRRWAQGRTAIVHSC